MLKPEAAAEELKKFKSGDFVRQRIARLAGLPEALQPDARTLFDLEEAPKTKALHPYLQMQERQKKLTAALQTLTPEKTQQLVQAIVPELAPADACPPGDSAAPDAFTVPCTFWPIITFPVLPCLAMSMSSLRTSAVMLVCWDVYLF